MSGNMLGPSTYFVCTVLTSLQFLWDTLGKVNYLSAPVSHQDFGEMGPTLVHIVDPNSDEHQISPCNINAYSTPEVTRIIDLITKGKCS